MFIDLITKNRSYRRFYEEELIEKDNLLTLIKYARLTPSGANRQTLKYIVTNEKEINEKVYRTLAWAGYLPDWAGPDAGERPSAYIVILQDKNNKMVGGVDHGIAAQSILLGAVEMGLGGCILGNIKRPQLQENLNISDDYEILLVLALGKPKETVVIEEIEADGEIKYWRDENQVHHVPKRKLEDIILKFNM
jgi:nitroreductase